MEAFQFSTCAMIVETTYALLLSKKIVGNSKELEFQDDLLRQAKENLVLAFIKAMDVSIEDSLKFTGIPIAMNYCFENLYSLCFENTYWKEHVINFATHQAASYLLIGYRIYSNSDRPLDVFEESIETMIFIYIFQNYGVVATFINLSLNNLLSVCRMRYVGW